MLTVLVVLILPITAIGVAIAAPLVSLGAAQSYAAARVSPLWFLLALVVVLIPGLTVELRLRDALVVVLPQALAATWLVYTHRRWPWSALLIAVVVIYLTLAGLVAKSLVSGVIA